LALADEPGHGSSSAVKGGWRENAHASEVRKPLAAFLHSWGKPLSSAALAASLTLTVVLSWQEFQPSSAPVPEPLVAAVQLPPQEQSGYSASSRNAVAAQTVSTQSVGGAGNVRRLIAQPRAADTSLPLATHSAITGQRFQVYMISHANHVSVANSAGMMPFARLISAGEK
jgi:negative regulator of sigma E activity